ncbi:hypothetical protein [Streptomyces bobili]
MADAWPGDLRLTGPAVLVGHIDTVKEPAVLKNVSRIHAGDIIGVSRADGTTAQARVREIEEVGQEAFPTKKVYGNIAHPELHTGVASPVLPWPYPTRSGTGCRVHRAA